MKNENYFQKNLDWLEIHDPSLAFRLTMTDPTPLEFCLTANHEPNLTRQHEGQKIYYHSSHSALKEAEDWFKALDLHAATVIVIYGVGLGYYYTAAKQWLKQHPHHELVFLEDDLSVLHRLLETKIGHQLLHDPQVKVCQLPNADDDRIPLFNQLTWTYFNSPVLIEYLKLYQEANPQRCAAIRHEILFQMEQKKAIVDEYLQCGLAFFRNFYPNLQYLPQSYLGNALFNSFSNVPAIICGAGPSLSNHLAMLPELKNRALLFAGGSALNALIPKGIIPHFGVAIDPNIDQYSRVAVAGPHSIPFFYRSRLYHEALETIKGPRLYLTGEGGYETPTWFEQQLNIEGEYLDAGHNVVNFSIQIARALGCNPIILIGTDLAFTNQEYYAKDIVDNLKLSPQDLKIFDADPPPLLQNDINGKPVYTLWKWVTESRWISSFAENHPEITLLNATEGGLGFKDVPNVTLKEATEKFLTQPQIDIEKIDQKIHPHALNSISHQRITELMTTMQKSLNHCIRLLSQLLEENDRLAEEIEDGKPLPSNLSSSQTKLLESDLESEVGYRYLLEVFSQIYVHLHHRDLEDNESPKKKISKPKQALNKLELTKQRYIYLRDVAQVNRDLIVSLKESSTMND